MSQVSLARIIPNFSLADQLNEASYLLPIVARRCTIKNGALRYFVPTFFDAKNYRTTKQRGDSPRVIFYLAAAKDDEKFFYDQIADYYSEPHLLVLFLSGMQRRDAVAESQALQEVMSDVLVEVYGQAPAIHNDLVNRDRPSSQVNAARNKLLYAMLHHEKEADLGIVKFPPEKAIYRSLLLATGLHKENGRGEWRFVEPQIDSRRLTPREEQANTAHAWARIN
jgi:hypothetical protein